MNIEITDAQLRLYAEENRDIENIRQRMFQNFMDRLQELRASGEIVDVPVVLEGMNESR